MLKFVYDIQSWLKRIFLLFLTRCLQTECLKRLPTKKRSRIIERKMGHFRFQEKVDKRQHLSAAVTIYFCPIVHSGKSTQVGTRDKGQLTYSSAGSNLDLVGVVVSGCVGRGVVSANCTSFIIKRFDALKAYLGRQVLVFPTQPFFKHVINQYIRVWSSLERRNDWFVR